MNTNFQAGLQTSELQNGQERVKRVKEENRDEETQLPVRPHPVQQDQVQEDLWQDRKAALQVQVQQPKEELTPQRIQLHQEKGPQEERRGKVSLAPSTAHQPDTQSLLFYPVHTP